MRIEVLRYHFTSGPLLRRPRSCILKSVITTQERRRIQTLDISPIHRVPNRKKRKLSDIEEETASDIQFSDTQARCEECRLDGKSTETFLLYDGNIQLSIGVTFSP